MLFVTRAMKQVMPELQSWRKKLLLPVSCFFVVITVLHLPARLWICGIGINWRAPFLVGFVLPFIHPALRTLCPVTKSHQQSRDGPEQMSFPAHLAFKRE